MCGWWRTDVIDISPTDGKTGSDFSCVRVVILIESTITWYLPQIVTCVPAHTFFPRKLLINSSWEASCHVNLTFCASGTRIKEAREPREEMWNRMRGNLTKKEEGPLTLFTNKVNWNRIFNQCAYLGLCVYWVCRWNGMLGKINIQQYSPHITEQFSLIPRLVFCTNKWSWNVDPWLWFAFWWYWLIG